MKIDALKETRNCAHCSAEFTIADTSDRRQMRRMYCSIRCRQNASYARKRITTDEVLDVMRKSHKRKSAKTPEGFETDERRRCRYHTDGVSCITILCRYNPGPYCFTHAAVISAEAVAEGERRQLRESKRLRVRTLEQVQRERYPLLSRAMRNGRVDGSGLPAPGVRALRTEVA
jgi:hypothetical protein